MTGHVYKCRVEVVEDATVVARGERVRSWFVRLNDGWVRAATHPLAVSDEASSEIGDDRCPPGTIWRRAIELELPQGTLLCAVETSPHVERRDPVEYLTREQLGMQRRTRRTHYRVAGNYRLVPVKSRETPEHG